MAKLEDLKRGATVKGILPDSLVTVIDVKWYGSATVELTYKDPSGKPSVVLLYRDREPTLEISEIGRPWSFDGDGSLFRLVSEAHRINLAHLFDPLLAIHTSMGRLKEVLPAGQNLNLYDLQAINKVYHIAANENFSWKPQFSTRQYSENVCRLDRGPDLEGQQLSSGDASSITRDEWENNQRRLGGWRLLLERLRLQLRPGRRGS